jgi:hypothetical protein
MKLREIYQKAISAGIDNDPRGRDDVLRDLARVRREYDGLKQEEKDFFDLESLANPYSDSRILNGEGETEVNTALVGIDVDVGELLLAESLKKRGDRVDLVLSHHPEGRAFADLYNVMQMQADILGRAGVPINIAEDLIEGRAKEIERKLMPLNHTRTVDAAKVLGVPFMCIHTPADNMVVTYLQKLFDNDKPDTLSEIVTMLRRIPEYNYAARNGTGPKILLGSEKRKAGKIFVDMTGGTEGSKEIFGSLTSAGVNTIVAMHVSEEHRKEAEKKHLNIVIAGHISSDNLGINLLLDEVTKGAPVKVMECSGFNRVSRDI